MERTTARNPAPMRVEDPDLPCVSECDGPGALTDQIRFEQYNRGSNDLTRRRKRPLAFRMVRLGELIIDQTVGGIS